jgi:hypothetical protein
VNEYRTKDFDTAVVLLTYGLKIVRVESDPNGRTRYFVFDATDNSTENILTDYYSGVFTASVREVLANVKLLKSMIFNQ